LSWNAAQSPPLGFFRNFVVERSGAGRDLIDLKMRGTSLVVDLARLYALEAGTPETNTLHRLRSAPGESSLSTTDAEELCSAFELINLFRLRSQYEQLRQGEQPNNYVPISHLSRLEQRDLKEAMRAIESHQRGVEHTFRTSLFG
jgi:CBS domain-containing protein